MLCVHLTIGVNVHLTIGVNVHLTIVVCFSTEVLRRGRRESVNDTTARFENFNRT